jgi:hypothetical protein
MIPDSYKPHQPERRKMDAETHVLLTKLSGKMETIDNKVDLIEKNIAQQLLDHRNLTEIQYTHFDAILEQQRQDNISQHKELISVIKEYIENIDRSNTVRADALDDRVGCLEEDQEKLGKRISELEQKEAKKALDSRNKIKETVAKILITAGVGAIVGLVAVIARWDDFVKLIGGKP